MKRFTYLLVGVLGIAVLAGACASTQQRGLDLVTRAVQASGGAVALGGVKTISEQGTVKQWDRTVRGGGGEMRIQRVHLEAGTLGSRATRSTGSDFHTPRPHLQFSEIVPDPPAMSPAGTATAHQQARSRIPPRIRFPPAVAAVQRELLRTPPLVPGCSIIREPLRCRWHHRRWLVPTRRRLPCRHQTLTVMFDRPRLPARIRTLDYDSSWRRHLRPRLSAARGWGRWP